MTTETAARQREFCFDDRDFAMLAALVKQHVGIVLGEQKRDLVYGRLARRLRALKLDSFAQYCELLAGPDGDAEIGYMVNAITTNLTSFFREPHHFATLADEVLKPMARQGRQRLRIWSAGCSSGEEPYSIAMTLRGAIPALDGWDARILATDIDTDMLSRAAAGRYEVERAASIPDACRKYCDVAANGDAVVMSAALKSLIAFKPLNLQGPWPMKGPFDAIFCRNVVIYFDKQTQRALFDRYADLLKPDGWLFIGHSESLFRVSERFELVGRTVYRRRR